MKREEWLKKNHSDESQVKRDEGGEFIHGWVEVQPCITSFPKIYLPEELQL